MRGGEEAVGRTRGRAPSAGRGAGRRSRGWNASATSTGTGSGAGRWSARRPGSARRGSVARPSARPASRASACSAEAQPRLALRRPCRRLDLGRGQEVGERVEVVADADAALGDRLEGRRAAAGERIEDDVAGPAVARDERVGEGRREAREVRAHRVERVAPQPCWAFHSGSIADRRQRDRQVQGQLLRGGGRSRASRSGRHGRIGPLTHAPIPVGAMGCAESSTGASAPRPPPKVPEPPESGWAHCAFVAYASGGSEDHAEPSDGSERQETVSVDSVASGRRSAPSPTVRPSPAKGPPRTRQARRPGSVRARGGLSLPVN